MIYRVLFTWSNNDWSERTNPMDYTLNPASCDSSVLTPHFTSVLLEISVHGIWEAQHAEMGRWWGVWSPRTSPIMTASSGAQSVPRKASRKKVFSGFPTTVALESVAYSSPVTKGPGPRDMPSFFLKYLALCIAIRGAPSKINLQNRMKKGVQK